MMQETESKPNTSIQFRYAPHATETDRQEVLNALQAHFTTKRAARFEGETWRRVDALHTVAVRDRTEADLLARLLRLLPGIDAGTVATLPKQD